MRGDASGTRRIPLPTPLSLVFWDASPERSGGYPVESTHPLPMRRPGRPTAPRLWDARHRPYGRGLAWQYLMFFGVEMGTLAVGVEVAAESPKTECLECEERPSKYPGRVCVWAPPLSLGLTATAEPESRHPQVSCRRRSLRFDFRKPGGHLCAGSRRSVAYHVSQVGVHSGRADDGRQTVNGTPKHTTQRAAYMTAGRQRAEERAGSGFARPELALGNLALGARRAAVRARSGPAAEHRQPSRAAPTGWDQLRTPDRPPLGYPTKDDLDEHPMGTKHNI